MYSANNQTMQGTANGIECILDIGRIIGLSIAAVASLVYVAGCTPNCESESRKILREHMETGQTTPLPSGSECYNVVDREAYEPIRAARELEMRKKAERARFYSKACQAHVPKSEGLEKACKEWEKK